METNQTALADKGKEAALLIHKCTINITNNSLKPMDLVKIEGSALSHYAVAPSSRLEPGEDTLLVLEADTFIQGAEGSVTYSVEDESGTKNQIDFLYGNPISGANTADWRWVLPVDKHPHLTATFRGRAGDQPWIQNGIEPDGSPVFVEYTVIV